MKKIKLINLWLLTVIFGLMAILPLFSQGFMAKADEQFICDDGFSGEGEAVASSYTVEYDSYHVNDAYVVTAAPSYGHATDTLPNNCGPVAGANIVGFYDRYYTNLIPDFTPGLSTSSGYKYYPSIGFAALNTLMETLYEEMQTNSEANGTSSRQFLTGLRNYVEGKGYSIGYESMYSSSTRVNYTKVEQMVNANRVGVIFCNRYNFVFGIVHQDNKTTVTKKSYNIGHGMMVYGYTTIDYYKDGRIFQTDTFLQVSSGFASGAQGYIKMDDYLSIFDAYIVTIT